MNGPFNVEEVRTAAKNKISEIEEARIEDYHQNLEKYRYKINARTVLQFLCGMEPSYTVRTDAEANEKYKQEDILNHDAWDDAKVIGSNLVEICNAALNACDAAESSQIYLSYDLVKVIFR